jgi:cellulose synthase/poly-beta-1,6-N-acetylglucosamine synthase-like glycosyltransferase/peptidoglycan/xylan/chitin deacetylase (PgdA/CDA1 family)
VNRPPRAHWLLFLLGVAVLLALLCLDGYANHPRAEGSGRPASTPATLSGGAPDKLAEAGPILRIAPDGTLHHSAMPARTVALTFDDGPDPQWTPRILDALREHQAKATFFVVGSRVNRHPDLVRRIIAEGHELGVHTFTHVDMTGAAGWRRTLELDLTRNAIATVTGRRTALYRPPYSSTPRAVGPAEYAALRDAANAGYLAVLADVEPADWRRPGVDAIVRAATPAQAAGGIVMLHDGGGDRSQTVEAVRTLLGSNTGTRYVTVSGGLQLSGHAVADRSSRWRGGALRWAQRGAGWAGTATRWILVAALTLAFVRLGAQLWCAWWHARQARRRRGRRQYLGPVTVVVPAYNEATNIAATVRSLARSDYPLFEVIVVDDGSTDGTPDVVERLDLEGVLVVRRPNGGKPAALNTGIELARSDLLVLVDADTVFEPDAIGRAVQPFADPRVGAVSGNTKVANRHGLLGRWQHLEYVVGFNLDRRMFDLGECMPTVPGAIGAFRRAALHDAGGVPADTLAEDTDLTMAVIRAGWRVVYEERAIAHTEAPATLRQLWRQRYRWCYGTMQAMWKHRGALAERGPAGRLGRRGIVYLVLFQVLLPLAAPAVDAYAVYGLLFLPWTDVAMIWGGLTLAQALTAAIALRLDHEPYSPLWTLPFQQLVYRQLMYLVVIQSSVAALLGNHERWR